MSFINIPRRVLAEELQAEFKRREPRTVVAYVGNADGIIDDEDGRKYYIYVSVGKPGGPEFQAYDPQGIGRRMGYGAAVEIKERGRMAPGRYEVVGAAGSTSPEIVYNSFSPRSLEYGGRNQIMIDHRQIRQLLIYPNKTPDMKFKVLPGWFLYNNTFYYVTRQQISASLSAPAAGLARWDAASIDIDTLALQVTAGSTFDKEHPEEGSRPSFPADSVPLGWIRLDDNTTALRYGIEIVPVPPYYNFYKFANPATFQARLTTTSGTPVVMADATAVSTLFLTPYDGNQVSLYNGSAWEEHTLTEQTIYLTITYNGNTTNGSPIITSLASTAGIHVGSEVSGTGIPVGAAVASIDSATQVTMDANATADGSGVSLTFSIPADTAVDVFLYDDSGTLKTECLFWTDTSTRATALTTQDGVYVKTGATGYRYAGSFCTTDTDAETEDSSANRLVYNYSHRVMKDLDVSDATSHTYGTATWRSWNNDDTIQASFFLGVADQAIVFGLHGDVEPGAAADTGSLAVGVDGSTSPAADRIAINEATFNITIGVQHIRQTFAIGYHYLRPLEYENAGGTSTTFDYVALQGHLDC